MKLYFKKFVFTLTVFLSGFTFESFSQSAQEKQPADFRNKIITYDTPVSGIIGDKEKFHFIAIGENHNEYSNHLKELEIISEVFKTRKKIAIGMEMFSADHQAVIDDYITGKIKELEFLEKTRYFNEWGFDFNLYKDILDFARQNKIPVIGLNIKNQIVRQIGRKSFREISAEEMKGIPGEIDFSNAKYRDLLREAFEMHGNSALGSFENFYLAQLIRDEYMSQKVSDYYNSHPDVTIVILAGNGHVEYGFGIPSRLERKTGKSCQKILIDAPYSSGGADFFIYTRKTPEKKSPKLNVMLSEVNNAVKINTVFEQPESEKNKLLAQDQIVSINDIPIKSVADIKLILFASKFGDHLKILIKREMKEVIIDFILKEIKEDTSED